ncbi:AMP-binding protein [Microbacterium aerolatum]|uniref:O-succinylbenzoic acid--CoA ligase n=1 Tax=Microbacterium aerolatum TaxID=153731 RepID=A0A511ADS1_9MICO|nr:AMP-binding protein [Microbacterium aerolatum]MCK3770041.1 AMP-binding protein [Microbacterium aerolatum]GEK86315.1 O-succinylbenzoic acid--CoA ligase [Microbacterium aerolatum]GGB16975.1 O-succinylbenzoic acid--CoA ligase [Microbacterium aerolatum]
MTRLVMTAADDAAQLQQDLVHALDGGPAIGLGMLGDQPREVEEGTAVVIGTSGSTGIPKRVVLSGEALRAGAESTAERIGSGSWLLALPAGYVAGLQVIVRSILSGTTPAVLDGGFSPRAFAEATLGMRPDMPLFTSLVPAQIATLVAAADDAPVLAALQAYQAILVGGQALPQPIRERAAELGVRLVRTYGSTETSGGCVYDGIPLDKTAVRTVDGELQIAGPMLADGYLGDAALTDRTFLRDEHGIRWYRTGDLGIVEDGVVRVHGRADNVIVSGGINVSLDRVERIVRGIPGLTGAVVVGVDDARWGEASVIVAPRGEVLRRSESEQLEHARAAVAEEIGKAARPARLILVDELATLASGKPDREAIRRIAAGLH